MARHLRTTNGPDNPPGLALSYAAIGIVISVAGLLFAGAVRLVAMDKAPIIQAIQTNKAYVEAVAEEVKENQKEQELVNRQLLEGVAEIKGILKAGDK